MGYLKPLNPEPIIREIHKAAHECGHPMNDGFVSWGIKQDLYQIKWIIDEAIRNCPTFGDIEAQWLKEQEQKQLIRILKDDI